MNKLYIYNKQIFGSGALPDKMLFVRIIENNKMMPILDQVRLSKGSAGLGNR